MPKESNLELKVGAFVLVAIMGLFILVFSITDSAIFEEGQLIKVVFEFANGVKKNAPVRIAGVEEGIVKDVFLFFDRKTSKTKVEIDLWIKKDIKVPRDSTVVINQLGLMGEQYVEIIPGIDTSNFYNDGNVIIGKDPISQDQMSEKIMEVANKIERSIDGVNKFIHDEKTLDSIGSSFENLSAMTGDLKDLVHGVKQGEGTLGLTFENINSMIIEVNEIFSSVKKGRGTIGRLLYDDALYEDLHGLTSDLRKHPWKIMYRPKGKKRIRD